MNLRTPRGRGKPGTPPLPKRVAAQRASGEAKGSSADQCRRYLNSKEPPALAASAGTHIALMLSWISSSVGSSISCTDPRSKPDCGSTHSEGRRS